MVPKIDTEMNALRFHPDKLKLLLESVPVPDLPEGPAGETRVVVEVKYCGFCGTDAHCIEGEFSQVPDEPVTMGHEMAGVVVKAGKQALKFIEPGARVGVNPNNPCFACEQCLRGDHHFCTGGGWFADNLGFFRDGGFAKYTVVNVTQVSRLPESVTFEQGALCEPLSCVLHGWDRLKKVGPLHPDSRVAVLGAGIVGNLWACVLHHHGIRDVVVSEPSPDRRAITEAMGLGFQVVDPKTAGSILTAPAKQGSLPGADVIIDCTGVPAALQAALPWAAKGGIVCVFGCAPVGKAMSLCPEHIFSNELTLFGVLTNPRTYARACALASAMGDRYLNLAKLGIQVFPLEEHEEARALLKAGKISKAMFKI